MDLQTIKDNIEAIQLDIDKQCFKGQNEHNLHLRDDLAIFFRKEILKLEIISAELAYVMAKDYESNDKINLIIQDMERELLKLEVPYEDNND